MAERDYVAELASLQEEIQTAQQQLGRLLATKDALLSRKTEILETCKRLNVEPKHEAIEQLIASVQNQLSELITTLDRQLRKHDS